MSETNVNKIYDKYIALAERRVKEAEKMITDAESRGDEDAKRAFISKTRFWKAQVEYLKTIKKVKTSFQNFDTVTLSDMVKEVLAKMGYTPKPQLTMDFARVDLFAEKDNECLLVEVKGPNDQVRSEQLIRYEDALVTQLPEFKKKVVLVLPVFDGENFAVWGLKQLTQYESKI